MFTASLGGHEIELLTTKSKTIPNTLNAELTESTEGEHFAKIRGWSQGQPDIAIGSYVPPSVGTW
jgi:hypothetical protein